MKKLALALAILIALLGVSTNLNAQTAHGIAKKPLSAEQVAIACEKDDPDDVLNVACEGIRLWLNSHRPGLNVKDTIAMATYIRTLTIVPCPVGTHTLNREVDGVILDEATNRWQRLFRPDEKCLYDNNRAEIQFSLSCWNSPYEILSVATAMPAPAPGPVVTETSKKLELSQNVYNSFYVNQSTEVHQQQILQPLLTKDQDRYHGWCGIWTNLGCTALAVGAGGVIYLATRDKGNDGVSPDADTGGAFIRAGLTARANLIPPRDGHGGGAFVGARIGW